MFYILKLFYKFTTGTTGIEGINIEKYTIPSYPRNNTIYHLKIIIKKLILDV